LPSTAVTRLHARSFLLGGEAILMTISAYFAATHKHGHAKGKSSLR
jgi:hypothetical protein